MKTPLYLAIDQGGQSSRALVFDALGHIQAQAQRAVAVSEPAEAWVEQDAEQLYQSVRDVVDDVVAQLAHSAAQIVVAGIATQRSNVVCWRKDDAQPLSAVISWQDRRAQLWLRQFAQHKQHIHQLTGLLLTPHYGASKLRWCLDHLPAVRAAYEQQQLMWGPLSSYLAYRLGVGKQHYVDPANAARTLLMSLKDKDWSPWLLELFGVPREPMPVCVPTVNDYGELQINDWSVPIRVTTGDQSAVIFAFGEPSPDVAYINMGTGAFIQRSTGSKVVHHPGLLSSIVYHAADATHYVLEGTVNGAGNALRAMEEQFGLSAESTELVLDVWLRDVQSPPLFLNGVAGLGAPFWVADFNSRFIGDGDTPQKMVAVAESIVFLIQVNLHAIQEASGELRCIRVTGGLAQSDGLCQRLADISGLTVQRPAQCEATAQGLAYLLSDRESSWASHIALQEFKPQQAIQINKRYHAWREAMELEIKNYD